MLGKDATAMAFLLAKLRKATQKQEKLKRSPEFIRHCKTDLQKIVHHSLRQGFLTGGLILPIKGVNFLS